MDTTRAARAAAADFLNCTSEEVTFGHNMTTLTYHLAHAIFSQAAGQRQGSAGLLCIPDCVYQHLPTLPLAALWLPHG